MTTAKQVKLSVEEIVKTLNSIQEAAAVLETAPVPRYVRDFGRYLRVKMSHLRFMAERLSDKLPEQFRGETPEEHIESPS